MESEQNSFGIYKGLQRPLVFKFLTGKFIYWALGSIIAGIVGGGLISVFISSFAGVVAMVAISLPLLFYTISKQKQGLHSKKREFGIYIVTPKSSMNNETEKGF